MCTSIVFHAGDTYTGRNLDLEYSFGERVVILPRHAGLTFRRMPPLHCHQAVIGMASVAEGYPLFAEGVNESGVYLAGLNFPGNACYPPEEGEGEALAPWELIPWLLGTCETAAQAAEQLVRIPLLGAPFRPGMPLAPLHSPDPQRDFAQRYRRQTPRGRMMAKQEKVWKLLAGK